MGMNVMKWKPLFAVLLGLLMVGVTAGSAMAISWYEKQRDSHEQYKPTNWGLTAQIGTVVKVGGKNTNTHNNLIITEYIPSQKIQRARLRYASADSP